MFKIIIYFIFIKFSFAQVQEINSDFDSKKNQNETSFISKSSFLNNYKNLRDPFLKPLVMIKKNKVISELQKIPIDQFSLLAVMTGPDRVKALLSDRDGKAYIVSEKEKIGVRGGYISKIYSNKVLVKEKKMNFLGEEEVLDFDILLPSDIKNSKNNLSENLKDKSLNQENFLNENKNNKIQDFKNLIENSGVTQGDSTASEVVKNLRLGDL